MRVPSGAGIAVATLTRLIAAVSLFAIEMQAATWSMAASLQSLVAVNLVVAAALVVATRGRGQHEQVLFTRSFGAYELCLGVLIAVIVAINVVHPLEGADPYHLDRVARIERLGTLAYQPAADSKVNVLGWTYELVLADIDQIPLIGRALVRAHGLFGIAFYVLALGAARTWFPGGRPWARAAVFVIPVVFHQFVLVKNDLFGAAPTLAVLAWLVVRGPRAAWREIAWAAWLTGFAITVKMTTVPLAAVLAAALLIDRQDRRPVVGALLGGGLGGVICGGLVFTCIENWRWYGDPLALAESRALGNRNTSPGQMAVSIVRFGVSLFDMGLVTRRIWPGRGGWGSTFGLPLIWAIVVLAWRCRASSDARRALWIAAGYFVLFAAVYPDADIAHRMVLAPGVMLVLVAIALSDGEDATSRRMRGALAVVMVLSAAQIVRSAALYFTQAL